MNQGLQLDIFIRELKTLIGSIIVKRDVLAKEKETVETIEAAEMYLMVMDGLDTFSSYSNFDWEAYHAVGCTQSDIVNYMIDKERIPYSIRDAILFHQRRLIRENYEEKNDYYRMMAGLPDYDDTDFLYAPANEYGIRTDIPIHQLDTGSVTRLRNIGVLAEMMKANPTKKYLEHLGDRAVSPYRARSALNYELLFSLPTDPPNIALDFKKFYANAREFYMITSYNRDIVNSYKYYDNFVGFAILIMAIQRLFASIFTEGITRDFYDVQLIRYLFASYSIPYIEDMTMNQLKILAKNLNIFLSYKSSNRVLFDLCAIFGFTNATIYKYLLVRDHIHDSVTGEPIFPKKTVVSGDGTITTGYDYDAMYNIYFQKVDVRTKDVNTALVDTSNRTTYFDMTVRDIYWVDDEELRNKIYKTELNYIESKYMSIDMMYKITAMMYEICHTFRMIIDNNQEFRKIYMTVPKVSPYPHDLYSVIIFMCAFWCRRYGFTGEIPLKPAQIAQVYGFNFHADLDLIINDIMESKYLDEDCIQYMLNFTVSSSKDVDRIYTNIKTLKDFIVEQLAATKDINVWRAYQKLYKSVLVVEDKKEVYTDPKGQLYHTYDDLLRACDPELAIYLDNIEMKDKKNIDEVMTSVLYRLENFSINLKYLHTAIDVNSLMKVLMRLINFFKSYTVDFVHASILYVLDDRYFNMLKLLDTIGAHVISSYDDGFRNKYYDALNAIQIGFRLQSRIDFEEYYLRSIGSWIQDVIPLHDKIARTVNSRYKDCFMGQYADWYDILIGLPNTERVKLIDRLIEFIVKGYKDEHLPLYDKIARTVNSRYEDHFMSQYADQITAELKHMFADIQHMDLKLESEDVYWWIKENFTMEETLQSSIDARLHEKLLSQYADNVRILTSRRMNDKERLELKMDSEDVHAWAKDHIAMEETLQSSIDARLHEKLLSQYADNVRILTSRRMNDKERLELKMDSEQVTFSSKSKISFHDKKGHETMSSWYNDSFFDRYSDKLLPKVVRRSKSIMEIKDMTKEATEAHLKSDVEFRDVKGNVVLSYQKPDKMSIGDSFGLNHSTHHVNDRILMRDSLMMITKAPDGTTTKKSVR